MLSVEDRKELDEQEASFYKETEGMAKVGLWHSVMGWVSALEDYGMSHDDIEWLGERAAEHTARLALNCGAKKETYSDVQ